MPPSIRPGARRPATYVLAHEASRPGCLVVPSERRVQLRYRARHRHDSAGSWSPQWSASTRALNEPNASSSGCPLGTGATSHGVKFSRVSRTWEGPTREVELSEPVEAPGPTSARFLPLPGTEQVTGDQPTTDRPDGASGVDATTPIRFSAPGVWRTQALTAVSVRSKSLPPRRSSGHPDRNAQRCPP